MIPLAIGDAILDKHTRHTCLETNTFLLLAALLAQYLLAVIIIFISSY
jgi:hypothetical protein